MIYRWAVGAAVGLAALIGAYFYGVGVGRDQVQADIAADLARSARAIQRAQAAIGEARVAIAAIELRRQHFVREIYREIPTVVRGDPVYRNICIGDDGVRLLDRAAAAANGRFAGGPADPAAGTAGPAADGRPGDGTGDDHR